MRHGSVRGGIGLHQQPDSQNDKQPDGDQIERNSRMPGRGSLASGKVSEAHELSCPRPAVLLRAGFTAVAIVVACVIGGKYVAPFRSHLPAAVQTFTNENRTSDPLPSMVTSPAHHQIAGEQQSAALPLPTVYGIYAVSNGELHELEALPGRVPDSRVFMSTPVKAASRTMLPNGRISFIVFRRDMTASAPDRVAVRVIARIIRGMTFDAGGQASTATLENEWTIRSTSYDLRVAPLNDNAEMLLLRPENDFAFPPGRYGLVLKGQAYDFSAAGPITEPVQCLEHVAAANGNFYSECRRPQQAARG